MNVATETITAKYRPVAERFCEATGDTPPSNTICQIAQSARLEAVKILGRWMCTEEAFLAYITAPAKARNQVAPKSATRSRSDAAAAKAQAEAVAYLESNGIK